ncbi:MAG: globin family protein [Arenicellales bacterium]
MTNKEIELVKASWANVVPISNLAAELFYGKLFEIDPALKSLFSDNLEEQGKKLMMMINTAVNGLDSPEQIVPAVKALGQRHADYGVVDAHYDTVGAALIWTLGQGLGDGFTDEVKNAWLNTYTLLACTMKEGAAEVDAA